jgi:hypothetical protein
MQARKNYFDSIFAPLSGNPEYNYHADDIDFQIEADYIGFMNPGMTQNIIVLGDKIGHIMNYGEGVYGGIFVGALYSEAFFESDIQKIIENALNSIPSESDYYKIIKDVIRLHQQYPSDWQSSWKELEDKWGDVDICGAGNPFNIDAKLNGAYIVMGLLYGDGDPMKTLEITTRCGQDSDCNPSNALAVLGVLNGFSKLPQKMRDGVKAVGDSVFINTDYSFNKAVENTFKYALNLIKLNGGDISGRKIKIKVQKPSPPRLEVSFPNVVFDNNISVFIKNEWKMKGGWKAYQVPSGPEKEPGNRAMVAGKTGDEIEFKFIGSGISLTGDWVKDGGKADVYLDGKLHKTIDTYYNFSNQQHSGVSIWHAFQLQPGEHTVKVVVKGEKRPESSGTNVYITSAIIFKTALKKSDTFKFSFE